MEKQTKAIVLLSAVLILMPFLINNSYALVPFPSSDPSLPEISLQLELRNSDGQLKVYTELVTTYLDDVSGIHKLLDTMPNKTITVKDGIKYETVHFDLKFYFNKQNYGQITTSPLYNGGKGVLTARYDGFIVQPGDVLYEHWKLVRIVH